MIMIRILGGKYKNRKLKYFKFNNVRPTQSRVKKSLFDTLKDIQNKDVLDLFCGVGTLGIEALSRGAKSVTFIDNSYNAISVLRKNLSLLSITDNYTIQNVDVIKFLSINDAKFDIILADPPYERFSFFDLIPYVSEILDEEGLFCYETSSKEKENLDKLNLKIKSFGSTQLIYWSKK